MKFYVEYLIDRFFIKLGIILTIIGIISIALTCVGCGIETPFRMGRYDVELVYLESDWGVPTNYIVYTQWQLGHEWTDFYCKLIDSDIILRGVEINNELILSYYQDMEDVYEGCNDDNYLEIRLRKNGSRKQLAGNAYTLFTWCRKKCISPPDTECKIQPSYFKERIRIKAIRHSENTE